MWITFIYIYRVVVVVEIAIDHSSPPPAASRQELLTLTLTAFQGRIRGR